MPKITTKAINTNKILILTVAKQILIKTIRRISEYIIFSGAKNPAKIKI